MQLIATRPRENAGALADKLRAAGHEVIVAPLLCIRPVEYPPLAQRAYQAVLITSANGARAVARQAGLAHLTASPAFVLGPSSAAAAERAGFSRIEQAGGDVAALARHVVATLRPADGPLLYVSGAVTRGDLAATLAASGFAVDRRVAYEARPADALPEPCVTALAAGTADGILLFSPRTAQIWVDLVHAAGYSPAAARLVHYCLSRNVARPVHDVLGADVTVKVARHPHEAAMLEMLTIPP